MWQDLGERAKALAGSWPSYAALGSFALYLLGYLALRFHLTVLGVGTDLAVLDERYLFAGTKFLIYLVTTVPIAIMLGLVLMAVVVLVAAVLYLTSRLLSSATRGKIPRMNWGRARSWANSASPAALAVAGVAVSLMLIQLVMRHCFNFSNLLLADNLREPDWVGSLFSDNGDGLLRSILLNEGGNLPQALYFSGLVAGLALSTVLLSAAWSRRQRIVTADPEGTSAQRRQPRALMALLLFLVAVQFLLLPVNYGVLIMDKVLPRVSDLGGMERLTEGQQAWLVWEGNEGMTYLVRSSEPTGTRRKLVTLPRKDVKRTEIVQYDPILRCLFVDQGCSP